MTNEAYGLEPHERSWQQGTVAPPPVQPPPSRGPTRPFVPGGGIATTLITLLAVGAVANLIYTALEYPMNQPFLAEARGEQVDEAAMMMSGGIMVIGGLLMLMVYITTIVFYCIWIHRAYGNLTALGWHGLRFSPGWVVGYHFIPILNLVRPVQAMSDIWRGSEPTAAGGSTAQLKESSLTPLVGGWWALWLLDGVLSQLSFRLGIQEDYDVQVASMYVAMVSGVISCGTSVALLLLVKRITSRQQQRYSALHGAGEMPHLPHWPQVMPVR